MTIVGATPVGDAPSQEPTQGHSAPLARVAPTLFHLTCVHRAPSIIAIGALIPNPHPFMPRMAPLVWMTDQPDLDPALLGLTQTYISCDRTQCRFMVIDYSTVHRWLDVVAEAPLTVLDPRVVHRLNKDRRPEHWWISGAPVPVVPA